MKKKCIDINIFRNVGEVLWDFANLLIKEFIASVLASTLKAPPTISTKPIIVAASTNPFKGEINKAKTPWGLLFIYLNEFWTTTSLPFTITRSYCPPGIIQVKPAINTKIENISR